MHTGITELCMYGSPNAAKSCPQQTVFSSKTIKVEIEEFWQIFSGTYLQFFLDKTINLREKKFINGFSTL
jgi:hypothetical protein